jgi:N-succinyldiaminopimelate aminotransferase
MNKQLSLLHPYPFEKLSQLLEGVSVPDKPLIALSLGEPKHPAPDFIVDLASNFDSVESSFGTYPPTKGIVELRSAIADFVTRRNKLEISINPETEVLPVTGTREALFAFAGCIVDGSATAITMMPNPFYQIYEGAALLAGSTPKYIPCLAGTSFKPDFSAVTEEEWQRCQLVYICTPGNPSGAIMTTKELQDLIKLSDKYNFVIASDECYSEIYDDESNPPSGLIEAAAMMGRDNFRNCVVFNSLSKRSNLPGLRSGYVCGDETIIEKFLIYRTYHGSAMPVLSQWVSVAAWNDEQHVIENRKKYRDKFNSVLDILKNVWPMEKPAASFYLWPETPIPDEEFTRRLIHESNIKVLPGSFLSRNVEGINPGANHVRMALVATIDECTEAAERMKSIWHRLR